MMDGTLSTKLLEHLECPVCRDNYDLQQRLPHILPCFHSVCDACLTKLLSLCRSPAGGGQHPTSRACSPKCPVCRQLFPAPGPFETIPVDFTKRALLETLHQHQLDSKTPSSDNNNPANHTSISSNKLNDTHCQQCGVHSESRVLNFCQTCSALLCEAHSFRHTQAVNTQAHRLIKLTDEYPLCHLHKLPLSLFCHAHRQLVCQRCIPSEHTQCVSVTAYNLQHELSILPEAASACKSLVSSLHQTSTRLLNAVDCLHSTETALRKEIHEWFTVRETQAQQSLSVTVSARREQLENHQLRVREQEEGCNGLLSRFESFSAQLLLPHQKSSAHNIVAFLCAKADLEDAQTAAKQLTVAIAQCSPVLSFTPPVEPIRLEWRDEQHVSPQHQQLSSSQQQPQQPQYQHSQEAVSLSSQAPMLVTEPESSAVTPRDHRNEYKLCAGQLCSSWGRRGKAVDEFNLPNQVAIDSDSGLIYVCDFENDRVKVLNRDGGRVMFTWGGRGCEDGQFFRPVGIALDCQQGLVFVSESGNNRIQVFRQDGTFVTKWGSAGDEDGEFDAPRHLAFDSAGGLLYVADSGNNRVQSFTRNGLFIRKWTSMQVPYGVAVDSLTHCVFVVEPSSLCILKPGSALMTAAAKDEQEVVRIAISSPLKFPRGIAIDSIHRRLYVCDGGHRQLQLFSIDDGAFLASWPNATTSSTGEVLAQPSFEFPLGVAVDRRFGSVYVSDCMRHNIQGLK